MDTQAQQPKPSQESSPVKRRKEKLEQSYGC